MGNMIYFDHNATTPLHPEVKKIIVDAMEIFGNPSSLHEQGRHAKELVDRARKEIAEFIGATENEIVFAGSGSEANNAILSAISCSHVADSCVCQYKCKTEIITTKIEHPCVLETAKSLKDKGMSVKFLDVDRYGKVKMDQFKEMISDKTGIVSVMMANNEIGTIQDIKEIARITHEHGALFHTDAVQAVGKIPIDVKDLDVDFLTLSGHKIYGPKGIGVMYIKKKIPFCPLIRGGHQEKGRRAGTENTLGIIALGKAIEMRKKEMFDEHERLRELKEMLKKGIQEKIADVHFNGHPTDCLTNTLNVSFDGAEGEAILLYLDLEGIAVSTGSACASGSLDPSHVLLATGVPIENAHGSIRISLGRENTKEDIERMLTVLPEVIEKIRSMSTVYMKGKKNE